MGPVCLWAPGGNPAILARPQHRLRVGELRVFYDVREDRVEVLAIIDKAQAAEWLEEEGQGSEEGAGE